MSTAVDVFRTSFGRNVFEARYAHEGCETWEKLATTVAFDVCGDLVDNDTCREIAEMIFRMEFIPGGRYLYYAGRPLKYYNNCYLLRSEEDTREDWAELAKKTTSCLMTGGGIGNDYSVYRPSGSTLSRTGGQSSGTLPAMELVNEIGRRVMQGGTRRSAIYASLNWRHGDVGEFLKAKDWSRRTLPGTTVTYAEAKQIDFNFHCPLDFTNVSLNYDDEWLNCPERHHNGVFMSNVHHALRHGEPGFSFNFGNKQRETLRNACTEVTSEDDSDVCNLGSPVLSNIDSLSRFRTVVELSTIFLLCGTLRADLPYEKVERVREKNRRLGLGLMGLHEWLLQRGSRYEVTPELHEWLGVYRDMSDYTSWRWADKLGVSRPVANRAIAPNGTIGILAGTTTGIEPIYSVACKRRWLKNNQHHFEYVVDPVARAIVDECGVDPDEVETSLDLAADPERRLAFQADVQDYVDMAISSTLNLPAWGSSLNNEETVPEFASLLSKYAPRLRGFTCYPDGARGGQPLTSVPYHEALKHEGETFTEEAVDVCSITGHGGTCGS